MGQTASSNIVENVEAVTEDTDEDQQREEDDPHHAGVTV